ncbi:MAG: CRISPR-associated ring nuclease Crn3/Csx3, partial [Bacteroidota bacterium]|nr:CRISPR-associated ring nuclease Crn3/Csx3 [Bacteroidota bacterium]
MEAVSAASPVELICGKVTDNYQIVHIVLHEGAIEPDVLATLRLPENEIRWDRGIILNGRAPLWLYGYLVHLCHPARWVAIVDPRRNGGVVVASHHTEAPKVGECYALSPEEMRIPVPDSDPPLSEPNSALGIAIAIVGPPHSGKSVFGWWLFSQLQGLLRSEQFNDTVYFLRGCPDGEGNWACQIPLENLEIIRYKHSWTEEFVKKVEDSITNLRQTKRLVLVDTGGKIDRKTQRILNCC